MRSGKKRLLLVAVIIFTLVVLANSSNLLKLFNYNQSSSVTNRTTAQTPTPSQTKDFDKDASPKQADEWQSEDSDMAAMPTSKSAKLSKWIVLAQLKSSEARRLPDTTVFTFSEFDVLRSIKGDYSDKTITLRTYGGRVDDAIVTEIVRFKFIKGEKYILFLDEKNSAGYPAIDPSNIFVIKTDTATATEYISPDPSDLPLYEAKTGKQHKIYPSSVTVEDFIFSLQRLVRLNEPDKKK